MTNRREFLTATGKTGAALILGFYLPYTARAASDNTTAPATAFAPNAWLRITPDNQITILVAVPEMGQGPRTALPMILAEELEADWSTIKIDQAPVIPDLYGSLSTGGSNAVIRVWDSLRRAGAQAREMLITAAAQKWQVDKTDCRAQTSTVIHIPTSRRLTYGALAEAAAALPVLQANDLQLKPPANFQIVGKDTPRVDIPSKVDGTAGFGIDVRVPDMLFAVIARCPHFGGKLLSADTEAAKAVPGVRAVFAVPSLGMLPKVKHVFNTAGGVAVVADSTWAALQGRKALKLTWDKGPGADLSSDSLHKLAEQQAAGAPTVIAVDRGNALKAIESASKTVEAFYELPFQAHATMEPMNATVHVHDGGVDVWSPTQIGSSTRDEIAELAEVPPDKVTVHVRICGGSFGRRYQWDYAAEAWQIAKEFKQPVQLMWTREDDIQHDFYRQYSYHRMRGALDDQGNVTAWAHRLVSTPIRSVFDSPESLKDPVHVASQELGDADGIPYATGNFRLDFAPANCTVPRAWWRSVSSSFNIFVVESFVGELAHAAGRDPFEFRIKLLDDAIKSSEGKNHSGPDPARFRAVLKLAAEKSGWGKPLPAGPSRYGRGIACNSFSNTYIAQVAEVSVDKDGSVRVMRVVCAIDCGTAINPNGVRAMAEGGINFGLTDALTGQITIKEGAVEQSNFHDYQVLRIDQAPDIEVYILPSTANPGGMGESAVPSIAPAVANAIFAATGVRIPRLPIDSDQLKAKASG